MNNLSEIVLVESKTARDGQIASTTQDRAEEILSKAKGLLYFAMHQGSRIATTEQVADFYEVTTNVVRDNVRRHRDEFDSDVVKVLKGKTLRDVREILSLTPDTPQATVWNPRGTLRLGMLLRDSEVAKGVRTALLNEVEESGQKSERIKELELQVAIAQANAAATATQLRLVEKTEALVSLHGIPTTLVLLGRSNEVAEVEKPVLEVISEKHNTRFKGQSLSQVANFLSKRHGVRFKSGAVIARYLRSQGRDDLIAQVPRTVTTDYIPEEFLTEVHKVLTSGSRQMLLGE